MESEIGVSSQDMNQAFQIQFFRNQKEMMKEKTVRLSRLCQDYIEEEQRMVHYESEIKELQQEKMAHVEELRLIHTDINTMDTVMKQCKKEATDQRTKMREMIADLTNMNEEVNSMAQALEIENFKPAEVMVVVDKAMRQLQTAEAKVAAQPAEQDSQQQHQVDHNTMTSDAFAGSMHKDNMLSTGTRHAQPPPMKSCLSCHQMIHRNAPICPLCKAKSRSRNPKKPKKMITLDSL